MIRISSRQFRAWCQLLRLPALFTVPGDPLAGFLLARYPGFEPSIVKVLPCVLAGLLLYAAGLVSNDYFDLKEDARDRPTRPLPSGAVSPSTAISLAVILFFAGIGISAFAGNFAVMIAVLLTLTIITYNMGVKRIRFLGPLNIGVCRGLNVLLGTAAAANITEWPALPLIAAAGITVYIAGVTVIAARETEKIVVGSKRWLPAMSLALCFIAIHFSFIISKMYVKPSSLVVSGVLSAAALMLAWKHGNALKGKPAPKLVAATVGRFIHGLLVVQASFAALCSWPGLTVAGAIILSMPALFAVSSRFYSS
jgi:heme O synthase-like polyprenyltransferase